jgi:hypothetical protein
LVNGDINEEKLVNVVTTVSNNNDTKLVDMLDGLNECTETTRKNWQKLQSRKIITQITGNIVDENDKSAKMLKCGTDKSPEAVAEIAERVKDDMLVWESHFIT